MNPNGQMDGTLRGCIPCDIAGKPWIFELAGSCGIGANFKRAIQRFRKYQTLAFHFAPTAALDAFQAEAYTGDATDALRGGFQDLKTLNGYPANLVNPLLGNTQTNLSQKGRPCPVDSAFVVCAIEFVAEPLKYYDATAGVGTGVLFGGQFPEQFQAHLQHEVLRHLSLQYKFSEDSCVADFDSARFYLSGLGKGFLDNASHNGAMLKGNVQPLCVHLPIIQGASENEQNISKLIVIFDPEIAIEASAIDPAITVAPENVRLLQEVTIVLSGYCMPRILALGKCGGIYSGGYDTAVLQQMQNKAADFNPLTGKSGPG